MIPKNRFEQFDEVKINNQKNGIILEYAFIKEYGTYNYLVDCEEEILTVSEQELKRV
ncbi:MAG: hypothetical protein ACTSWD_04645 [Candidatus Heimdallarchaeota archaeon]